jgi:hypothetical protein
MAKEKGTPIVENSARDLKKRVAAYLQGLSNKLSE